MKQMLMDIHVDTPTIPGINNCRIRAWVEDNWLWIHNEMHPPRRIKDVTGEDLRQIADQIAECYSILVYDYHEMLLKGTPLQCYVMFVRLSTEKG